MTGPSAFRTEDLPLAPVDATMFKEGMSRLGAAVGVVTTSTANGPVGFTATAICSVTDTPPTLLVCLNRSASVHPDFDRATTLCINMLAANQEVVAQLFGGRTAMVERFDGSTWKTLRTGAPVLSGAALSADCQITERLSVGSHDILFCRVLALEFSDDAPALAYHRRQFHSLPACVGR
ncbi:flavin reductase [Jiella mangrovi]|uniref:Flavin reductase n=1 Tax=Jiella mangrovi TaxID=2821407 RepID=A0ABS4BGA0_9HYPH|nr:flavin reductase [Jiella mangrovi]MBP0615079.1 flavin reductase [Jiella mangrovi]